MHGRRSHGALLFIICCRIGICLHDRQAVPLNPFHVLCQAAIVLTFILQHVEANDQLALAAASTACLSLLLRAATFGAAVIAAKCRHAMAWARRSNHARMAVQ